MDLSGEMVCSHHVGEGQQLAVGPAGIRPSTLDRRPHPDLPIRLSSQRGA